MDLGPGDYYSSVVSSSDIQNKTFESYALEGLEVNESFHEKYKRKKGVILWPYFAMVKQWDIILLNWLRIYGCEAAMDRCVEFNQSNHQPNTKITYVDMLCNVDVAGWLTRKVSKRDFVVADEWKRRKKKRCIGAVWEKG